MIHYDPWWNPAVEDQASDRAHRIGQTKSVFVYKLIAADTVEERIVELQERKAALASLALSEDGMALPAMERRISTTCSGWSRDAWRRDQRLGRSAVPRSIRRLTIC